jgi:transglutaminase-like putative cysteine protease
MKRRSFVAAAAASPLVMMLHAPSAGRAAPAGATGRWRSFELVVTVNRSADTGRTRLWLPLPQDTPWQRVESVTWSGNAPALGIYRDTGSGVRAFHAAWSDSAGPRTVTLTTRVGTLDRHSDLAAASAGSIPEHVAKFLKPNAMITTDGIVRETADKIVKGTRDPLAKAQAIYDWIVENTFRDPKVRGCGVGDIRAMLETGNLGGKCADLNALFVGLARAAGIPARDVYGVRIADSAEFKSLGKAGDISKAQHCRAEFYLASHGWVPVDPADVRKIVLEERGGLPLTDPTTQKARAKLFGQWEMNWLAYNYAHDVELPNSKQEPVAFLMYPQAETGDARKDSLDPDGFRYRITSRELGI